MEAFKTDVEDLCAEWTVWRVVALDVEKRECIMQRSDEDQASITITVPVTYPKGNMNMVNVFGYHHIAANINISDAMDEALEKWCAEENPDRQTSTQYFEAAMQMAGGTGIAEEVDNEVLKTVTAQVMQDCSDPALCGLAGYHYDAAKRKFVIRVGMNLDFLDKFRANSLGLNKSKILALELRWPWQYTKSTDMPEIPAVLMCSKQDLSAEMEHPNLNVGGLKWYLNNRMNTALRKNHVLLDRAKEGFDDSKGDVEGLPKFDGAWEDFYAKKNSNILAGIQKVLKHRVQTCTKVCLICDTPLPIESMKTAICDNELCRHSLENYGIGTDVLSEIANSAEVCELLIYATCAAAHVGTSRDTFNPMCPVCLDKDRVSKDYRGPLHYYNGSYATGSKNFKAMSDTLQKIPKIKDLISLAQGRNDTLRNALNFEDPLIYPFLQWIFASNRAHLEPLPKEYQIKGLGEFQYYLISSSPEKEQRFRSLREDAKKKKGGRGSFFVWHGSQCGNWHCILRSGLKNYSNTKLMSAGAAYGAGIYTAKTISTSVGYMGSPYGPWHNSDYLKHKSGCTIIALCEVADDPSGYKDHGEIITVQNEELVDTRFLFVFPDGFKGDNSLNSTKLSIPEGALAHTY